MNCVFLINVCCIFSGQFPCKRLVTENQGLNPSPRIRPPTPEVAHTAPVTVRFNITTIIIKYTYISNLITNTFHNNFITSYNTLLNKLPVKYHIALRG